MPGSNKHDECYLFIFVILNNWFCVWHELNLKNQCEMNTLYGNYIDQFYKIFKKRTLL